MTIPRLGQLHASFKCLQGAPALARDIYICCPTHWQWRHLLKLRVHQTKGERELVSSLCSEKARAEVS